MGWVEHELLAEKLCVVITLPLLILNLLEWPWLHIAYWYLILLLKKMLWKIIPLVIVLPQALDGGGGGDHWAVVVAEGSAAEFAVHLLDVAEGGGEVFVQQRNVFDEAVDEGGGHVRMLSTAHVNFDV